MFIKHPEFCGGKKREIFQFALCKVHKGFPKLELRDTILSTAPPQKRCSASVQGFVWSFQQTEVKSEPTLQVLQAGGKSNAVLERKPSCVDNRSRVYIDCQTPELLRACARISAASESVQTQCSLI